MWVEFDVGSRPCSEGFSPGTGFFPSICGLRLLLVFALAPRVFLRVLWFFPSIKKQHLQIPLRPGREVFTHEPLAREIRRLLPTL